MDVDGLGLPDPWSTGQLRVVFQRLLSAIPSPPATDACSICKAQVLSTDMTAHIAWHGRLQAQIKAANPLISLSLLATI